MSDPFKAVDDRRRDARALYGKKVKDSPMGPGEVTNVTHAGFPEVNGVACAWCEMEDGAVFDPYDVREKHLAERQPK